MNKAKRTSYGRLNIKMWNYFKDCKAKGVQLNRRMLKEKALLTARELGFTNFKGSEGWLDAFKRRHKINFSEMTGQEVDYEESADVWGDDGVAPIPAPVPEPPLPAPIPINGAHLPNHLHRHGVSLAGAQPTEASIAAFAALLSQVERLANAGHPINSLREPLDLSALLAASTVISSPSDDEEEMIFLPISPPASPSKLPPPAWLRSPEQKRKDLVAQLKKVHDAKDLLREFCEKNKKDAAPHLAQFLEGLDKIIDTTIAEKLNNTDQKQEGSFSMDAILKGTVGHPPKTPPPVEAAPPEEAA